MLPNKFSYGTQRPAIWALINLADDNLGRNISDEHTLQEIHGGIVA